jgi:hypothetical protein
MAIPASPRQRTHLAITGITAMGNRFFEADQLNHRVLIYQGQ